MTGKTSFGWVLGLLLAMVTGLPGLAAENGENERLDLRGRVLDEDGNGVPGAMVLVHSGRQKKGTPMFSSTGYPDCGKQVKTGEDGAFLLSELDGSLKFRLLAVKKGFEPMMLKDVDPTKKRVNLVLLQRDPETANETNRLAGQVFDPEGKPMAGAVLFVEAAEKEGGSVQHGGVSKFLDETMVSDDRGFFFGLVHDKQLVRAIARLESPGIAPRWVSLRPGKDHLIRSGRGAVVTGRILDKNKPVAGVVVGLASKDRSASTGFYDLNAITDKAGRFRLETIPPNHVFNFYGKMSELKDRGSVRTRTFESLSDGKMLDMGDIPLGPAHFIRGRIVMPEGETIPSKTRFYLGREEAWDSLQVDLGADGIFEIQGVPPESISMSFRIKGYRLSKKNPSLDWLNGQILGVVDKDHPEFKVLLEKGDWDYQNREMPGDGVEQYPKDLPLRSAN